MENSFSLDHKKYYKLNSNILITNNGLLGCGDLFGTKFSLVFSGNIKQAEVGTENIFILTNEGLVYCCGDFTYIKVDSCGEKFSKIFVKIENVPLIQQISVGTRQALLLDYDGFVWVGGKQINYLGSLTYDSFKLLPNVSNIMQVDAAGLCTSFLDENGKVYTNIFKTGNKEIIKINTTTTIVQISAGYEHLMLLDVEGNVFGIGNNDYGQLGTDYKNIEDECIPIKLNNIPQIKKISCGLYYTVLLDINNNVWNCGINEECQLGRSGFNDYCFNIVEDIPMIKDIYTTKNNMFLLDFENIVWVCGSNKCDLIDSNTKYISKIIKIPAIEPIFKLPGYQKSMDDYNLKSAKI